MREHLEGLREAMVAFVRYAERAGLRAEVPTTPGWRVRRLISHQGLVHRWATAHLRGRPLDEQRTEAEGMNHDDPLDWLREGTLDLVAALMAPEVSPDALVFLADAPPVREFWARRQCHETTIHAADALAASLGRTLSVSDAPWITDRLALDGIDELLTGFLPRRRSRVRSEVPFRLGVQADGHGWVVDVSDEPPVTRRVESADGDVVVAGSPTSTYLSLWGRSQDVTSPDPRWAAFLEHSAVQFS